jgi:transaldolase
MKIIVNTSNIDEIKTLSEYKFVDGISIDYYSSKTTLEISNIKQIIRSKLYDPDIVKQIHDLAAKKKREIFLSLPYSSDAFKHFALLAKDNLHYGVDGITSIAQAITAAKSGATFATVPIDIIEGSGVDAIALAGEVKSVFDLHEDLQTEVAVSAVKNPHQIARCAQAGVAVVIITYNTIGRIFGTQK